MAFDSLDPSNYPNLLGSTDSTPSLQTVKKLRITKWLFGLTLFLIAGGSYLVYRQFMPQQQAQPMAAVPVEQTNLTIAVSANGTVEPEQTINVSPKTAGILKSLLVKEGDFVSKGQAIAYMDDSDLQRQLAVAQANLAKLLAGNRKEDIAQAQDDLRRNQELFTAGAISRQAYNQASTARATAQAQVIEAQQALALSQAGSRQEDIAAARASGTVGARCATNDPDADR